MVNDFGAGEVRKRRGRAVVSAAVSRVSRRKDLVDSSGTSESAGETPALPFLAANSISQKTFVTDDAHVGHHAMHAGWQKFFAQARESWRICSAEQIRRDREIKFVNQSELE